MINCSWVQIYHFIYNPQPQLPKKEHGQFYLKKLHFELKLFTCFLPKEKGEKYLSTTWCDALDTMAISSGCILSLMACKNIDMYNDYHPTSQLKKLHWTVIVDLISVYMY